MEPAKSIYSGYLERIFYTSEIAIKEGIVSCEGSNLQPFSHKRNYYTTRLHGNSQ